MKLSIFISTFIVLAQMQFIQSSMIRITPDKRNKDLTRLTIIRNALYCQQEHHPTILQAIAGYDSEINQIELRTVRKDFNFWTRLHFEGNKCPMYGSLGYALKEWKEYKPTYIAELIERLSKRAALLAMLLKSEESSNQPIWPDYLR